MSVHHTIARTRAAISIIGLALLAAGCGAILNVDDPGDSARIRITGTSSVPLRLVLSNNFIQVLNSQTNEITVSLLGSDTFEINVPIDQTYELKGRFRFFMRLINPDTATADLRIRIDIDGVDPYDVQTTLSASQHEYTFTAF